MLRKLTAEHFNILFTILFEHGGISVNKETSLLCHTINKRTQGNHFPPLQYFKNKHNFTTLTQLLSMLPINNWLETNRLLPTRNFRQYGLDYFIPRFSPIPINADKKSQCKFAGLVHKYWSNRSTSKHQNSINKLINTRYNTNEPFITSFYDSVLNKSNIKMYQLFDFTDVIPLHLNIKNGILKNIILYENFHMANIPNVPFVTCFLELKDVTSIPLLNGKKRKYRRSLPQILQILPNYYKFDLIEMALFQNPLLNQTTMSTELNSNLINCHNKLLTKRQSTKKPIMLCVPDTKETITFIYKAYGLI